MSDDEFDSFDDGDPGNSVQPMDADDVDNRREYCRDLSIAMTQKLFGNPGNSTQIHMEYDDNAYVEPRNRFEKLLEEENVRIVRDQMDEDSDEFSVVFGGNLNHEELIRKMEKRLETERFDVFDEFEAACNHDQRTLALYMSPAKSRLGLHDTLFRVFLQIRSTQTKSFGLLLQKLDFLAKKTENESDLLLAQTCVAHMRHLSRLFEPQAVFNTIFEYDWKKWSPGVRNDLIAALPEIFTDISLQQLTALRLNQEIQETQGIPDLPSFQFQIIETLRLLRMDPKIGRQIRQNLCNLCMEVDVNCLPSLIAFALGSLVAGGGGGAKVEEEESLFHEMLRQLSRLLKIDVIRKKTNKSDALIIEIFSHFLKFLQLDKRGWKHLTTWISKKKETKETKEEEQDEEAEEEEAPATWLTTFDAFLIFSILPSADPGFSSAVNTKIQNIPTGFQPKFLKIVDLVIGCQRFATCHLSALIHVARHCFWSPDTAIRQMGVAMWKQLLVGMEKKERVKVFSELMKHFSQSESECESVLDVFFKVIKSTNSAVIMEFSTEIQRCIELIHTLSIPNIKRLFQVMILMSMPASKTSTKVEIDEIINRFLISVSEREKFLGVLALLMKIQVEMGKKHSENQETQIREGIQRIEEAVRSSTLLRAAFYEHFRSVIHQHKRIEEIRFLVEWSQCLLTRFKEEFFVSPESQDSQGSQNSVDPEWILKPDPQRLQEIAPMFQLILEMQVLKMRWKEEEEVSSSYDICVIKDLNFAFEATLPAGEEEIPTERDQRLDHLFFLIQWTRTVLNAFLAQTSTDFLSKDEVTQLATRKFKIMIEAEKKLSAGMVATWHVPNLTFGQVVTIEMAKQKKKGTKRRSDETIVNQTTTPDELLLEAEEEEETPNVTCQLKTHFVQLKLRPLVHIMQLAENKRSCLKYLCGELQTVFDHLIRQKKKTPPMLAARLHATSPTDRFYHGDSMTVWSCVKKATDRVWGIVELVFEFFSNLPAEPNYKMQKDLEELGEKALKLIHCVLSWMRRRKRKPERLLAKYALAYLKKDWSKVDECWSKGTRFTNAVKDILQHYINLRKESDQLRAIQWILTNKVVQLVPENDRRISCVFSQASEDDLLGKEDQKAQFYCISKATFQVIFKTLFGSLNARCLKYDMSLTAAKNQAIEDEATLELWETASSCFLILCLLLRINKIRTTAALTTAIREGKQFLINVSKKSSFIFLMDNITKGTNFEENCRRVEKILSAVQQGNRVLQSIGTYAKTHKCVHLLKKFPELRAESENCLRVIHSAMVKNECLNAFTVGLVKSRSIDGEIITDQPDTPMDSDED
uniref:Nucleolar protein n=1 Tax=Caenorhabditis tropicalis TaxID=1561998 RepID=A0A1I7UIQ8_9PELO